MNDLTRTIGAAMTVIVRTELRLQNIKDEVGFIDDDPLDLAANVFSEIANRLRNGETAGTVEMKFYSPEIESYVPVDVAEFTTHDGNGAHVVNLYDGAL